MKNRFLKILLTIILLFSLLFVSFKQIENIKADSGWDSDYDSSWDSGSDWGSSSWDDDYDYDYDNDDWDSESSSSGSYSGDLSIGEFFIIASPMIAIVLFALVIGIITSVKTNKNLNNEREKRRREYLSSNVKQQYNKLTSEQATKIIPNFNIEEFNFKAYQIFYDTQIAWMNFDYGKLKDLLTDELYNSYIMDLDVLKVKNQKNTMEDFELVESYIFDLKEQNGKYIAKVCLNVKFYDYIKNINTGVVLRGTPNKKLNNTYILTFIRTKEESSDINICPRCGAPVEGNHTGICEYCKSKLINENYNWIMSKKEKINQK